MNYLATLHTSDKTLFYVTFQAENKGSALDKIIEHLATHEFIISDDEIIVRCSDVLRCKVDVAPTLEEEAEEAKRLINNYVSNYGYDYDLPLLLTVYNLNQNGKYMDDNKTLQSTVNCLFHELQTVSKYNESLEGE